MNKIQGNQWKNIETQWKTKENEENQWKMRENAGKPPKKKTRKMEEKQWTSKENGGEPLQTQGKWRKTIGKHQEKLARAKKQKIA